MKVLFNVSPAGVQGMENLVLSNLAFFGGLSIKDLNPNSVSIWYHDALAYAEDIPSVSSKGLEIDMA